MEIIESRSVAVMSYSVWRLVCSLKLVASNPCMKQCDAFSLRAYSELCAYRSTN